MTATEWWRSLEEEARGGDDGSLVSFYYLAECLVKQSRSVTNLYDFLKSRGSEAIDPIEFSLALTQRKATTSWLISDLTTWPDSEIDEALNELGARLLRGAPDAITKWWEAFIAENSERLSIVYRLAEELRNRGATIEELYRGYEQSSTTDVQANLFFIDYLRLKQAEEARRRNSAALAAGTEPTHVAVIPYTAAPSSAILTNTHGWTEMQLQTRLDAVMRDLDWANTSGSAKKWWEAFIEENKRRIPLVLRLSEELGHRKCTITEFFLAYVYSNTDDIDANLAYLDYTRLKKAADRKSRERAAKEHHDAVTRERIRLGFAVHDPFYVELQASSDWNKFDGTQLLTALSAAQGKEQLVRHFEVFGVKYLVASLTTFNLDGPFEALPEPLKGKDRLVQTAFLVATRRIDDAGVLESLASSFAEAVPGDLSNAFVALIDQAEFVFEMPEDGRGPSLFVGSHSSRDRGESDVAKRSRAKSNESLKKRFASLLGMRSLQIPMKLRTPLDFHRFSAETLIARSSTSAVFAGRAGDGDPIAIKVKLGAERASERLRREALAMVSSHHPYVLRLEDFESIGNIHFLTTELCDSKIGPMPNESMRWRRMAELLEGLTYVHRVGILHRNLSPTNILLSAGEASVRIADFSMAALPGDDPSADTELRMRNDPRFTAPECRQPGATYTIRADYYSAGAIWFWCLGGNFASEYSGDHQIVERLKELEIHDRELLLVSSMLSRDPAQRPTTKLALMQLREVIASRK